MQKSPPMLCLSFVYKNVVVACMSCGDDGRFAFKLGGLIKSLFA